MTKLYEDSKDLHVRKTYIYAKANDEYAYADAAKTEKIPATDLQDMFRKGVIVVDNGVEYSPVSFNISEDVGTLTYVKTDGTTATTAVLETLSSEEYTAG